MVEDVLKESNETSIVKRNFLCKGFYLLTSTESIYVSNVSNTYKENLSNSQEESIFNVHKINYSEIERSMLDKLRRTFDRKYGGNIVDSIIMEKHNNEIVTLFMNNLGKYYVHIYENNSSYEEVNLNSICNDIIKRWGISNEDLFWWEVLKDEENKETLKGAAMIHLKNFDEFDFAKSQPITTLLSWLLHSNEMAKEFTIIKNIKTFDQEESNGEKSIMEQIGYFKRNPDLLKYSHLEDELSYNTNKSTWKDFENIKEFLKYRNSLY